MPLISLKKLCRQSKWAVVLGNAIAKEARPGFISKFVSIFPLASEEIETILQSTPIILLDDLSEAEAIKVKRLFDNWPSEIFLTQDEAVKRKCSRTVWHTAPNLSSLEQNKPAAPLKLPADAKEKAENWTAQEESVIQDTLQKPAEPLPGASIPPNHSEKNPELESRNAELAAQLEIAQALYQQEKQRWDHQKEFTAKLNEDIHLIRIRHSELTAINETLKTQNEQLQNELLARQTAHDLECQNLQSQIENLKTLHQTLAQEQAKASGSEDELIRLERLAQEFKAKGEASESELEVTRTKLQNLKHKLETLEQTRIQLEAAFEKQNIDLANSQEENATYKAKLQALHHQHQEESQKRQDLLVEKQALSGKAEELTAQLAAAEQTIQTLKNEQKERFHNEITLPLQTEQERCAELTKQCEGYQAAIVLLETQAKENHSQIENLQNVHTALKTEKSEWEAKLREAEEKLKREEENEKVFRNTLTAKMEGFQIEIKRLYEQNLQLQTSLSESSLIKESLQASLLQKDRETEALQEQNRKTEEVARQAAEYRALHEAGQQEIHLLQSQCINSAEEQNRLNRQIQALEIAAQGYQEQIENLQTALKDHAVQKEQELCEKDKTLAESKIKFEQLETEEQERFKKFSEQLQLIEENRVRMEKFLQDRLCELNIWREKNQTLQAELLSERDARVRLEGELRKFQGQGNERPLYFASEPAELTEKLRSQIAKLEKDQTDLVLELQEKSKTSVEAKEQLKLMADEFEKLKISHATLEQTLRDTIQRFPDKTV